MVLSSAGIVDCLQRVTLTWSGVVCQGIPYSFIFPYNLTMRIIGIDPGIGRTGWGIIEKTGSQITPIIYDCFETSAKEEKPKRFQAIFNFLQAVLIQYSPHVLAIEELFFNTNAKTALIVGE